MSESSIKFIIKTNYGSKIPFEGMHSKDMINVYIFDKHTQILLADIIPEDQEKIRIWGESQERI